MCFFFLSLITTANDTIRLNPSVRHGVLSNGFKYYLHSTGKAEKGLKIRFLVKCGFAWETRDQVHLSHVIEHMAFSSPVKGGLTARQQLARLGLRFGYDYNASTQGEHTEYIFNLQEADPRVIAGCLSIIKEWSNNISMDSATIELDRRSVLQEIGMGVSDGSDAFLRKVLCGDTYVPLEEQVRHVKNFRHDVIRKLFRDRYQPDRQAVIVIGDIPDVAALESAIRDTFSVIPRTVVQEKSPEPHCETAGGFQWTIETRKNMQGFNFIKGYYVKGSTKVITYEDMKRRLISDLFVAAANQRLEAFRRWMQPHKFNADAFTEVYPHGSAHAKRQDIGRVVYTLATSADIDKQLVQTAIKRFLEMEHHLMRYGITEEELRQAKEKVASAYTWENKGTVSNLLDAYMQHFADGEAAPGRQFFQKEVPEMLAQLTVKDVNAFLKQLEGTKDIGAYFQVQKDRANLMLTQKELAVMENSIRKQKEIRIANIQLAVKEPAVTFDTLATPRYTIKETGISGSSAITLENGTTIIFKQVRDVPTSERDRLYVAAVKRAGALNVPEQDRPLAYAVPSVVALKSHLGLTSGEFEAFREKTDISLNQDVKDEYISLSGSSKAGELKWLLGMLNERMRTPGISTGDFEKLKAENGFIGDTAAANIKRATVLKKIFGGIDPFKKPATDLKRYTFADFGRVYESMYQDSAKWTIIVTGDFNPFTIVPLVAKYFQKDYQVSTIRNGKGQPPMLHISSAALKKNQIAQAQLAVTYYGKAVKSYEERVHRSFFCSWLRSRLAGDLREKKALIYDLSAFDYDAPGNGYQLDVSMITSDTANTDAVFKAYDRCIQESPGNKALRDWVDATISHELISVREKMATPRFWRDYLVQAIAENDRIAAVEETESIIQSITADDLDAMIKRYLFPEKVYDVGTDWP